MAACALVASGAAIVWAASGDAATAVFAVVGSSVICGVLWATRAR